MSRPALGPLAHPARRSLNGDHPGEVGTALPPLVDHHVHLMLLGDLRRALARLTEGGLAGVVDLGAPLSTIAPLRGRGMPRIDIAGPILTAPGGYPVDRPWAPPGTAREIRGATRNGGDTHPGGGPSTSRRSHTALSSPAETAVHELHAFGASVVKVALNAAAGPVFDRATLQTIVAAARALGLPVVAHVEGDGMSRLAIDAGVDALAHTPFTERVDDDLVERAVAQGQRWISTLFVQGYGEPTTESDLAADNLARFHRAGGEVLYGTDLGNGDQPVGVHAAELAALVRAGLETSDLIAALTDPWPRTGAIEGVATFVPGPPPASRDDVPGWLARARVVPAEELVVLEPSVPVEATTLTAAHADPSTRFDRDVTA